MSVLFLDCSQGISEQALLSGLMNLGLFSELLVPLADLFPSNADEIRRAIRNKTFSTIQIAGKTKDTTRHLTSTCHGSAGRQQVACQGH